MNINNLNEMYQLSTWIPHEKYYVIGMNKQRKNDNSYSSLSSSFQTIKKVSRKILTAPRPLHKYGTKELKKKKLKKMHKLKIIIIICNVCFTLMKKFKAWKWYKSFFSCHYKSLVTVILSSLGWLPSLPPHKHQHWL